jgi:hypothetical protein
MRIMTAGFAVMVLLTLSTAFLSYRSYKNARVVIRSQNAVIIESQRLRRLSQVSQMTASLAILTGEQ